MSYQVFEAKGTYDIVEKETGLVVATKHQRHDATKTCRALNLGAGFNGFTPTFFTLIYPGKEKAAQ